jgi:arginine utilization protein RocB
MRGRMFKMIATRNEVLNYTDTLVRIESIVNTQGEIEIANKLYEIILSMPYFKERPQQAIKPKTVDDEFDRYNVLAFVEGTKDINNKKTVILMGHLDTVGIDDYTNLKDVACTPSELMEKLKDEPLPSLVKEQLLSGEWYFGRGVLDMKSGVASHLALLKYYAEHPDELSGNLIFFAECDEEVSSKGVLSGLKDLKNWKKEYGFDYIGLINSDFVAPLYEGDENRYIYKGTVGKLLPSFFITGAETHVGSAFEGLDPNYIAA